MNAGRFLGLRIDESDVARIEGHVDVDDASLGGLLRRLAMLLVDVDAFDDDFVELGINPLDDPLLPFVGAGDDDHGITFFDLHISLLIAPRRRAR